MRGEPIGELVPDSRAGLMSPTKLLLLLALFGEEAAATIKGDPCCCCCCCLDLAMRAEELDQATIAAESWPKSLPWPGSREHAVQVGEGQV